MNVYTVKVLDKHDNLRHFIQSGESADEAEHTLDKKLTESDFFRCSGPYMHVETEEMK
jgi:hypothetical protein